MNLIWQILRIIICQDYCKNIYNEEIEKMIY